MCSCSWGTHSGGTPWRGPLSATVNSLVRSLPPLQAGVEAGGGEAGRCLIQGGSNLFRKQLRATGGASTSHRVSKMCPAAGCHPAPTAESARPPSAVAKGAGVLHFHHLNQVANTAGAGRAVAAAGTIGPTAAGGAATRAAAAISAANCDAWGAIRTCKPQPLQQAIYVPGAHSRCGCRCPCAAAIRSCCRSCCLCCWT